MIGIYVLGLLRMHGDDPVRDLGAGRLMTGLLFLALGLNLAVRSLGVFGGG